MAPRLEPPLLDALAAADEIVAAAFNALGLCEPVPASVSRFYGRPLDVIHGDRFAAAPGDDGIQPEYFGTTTQWIDSPDALHPRYARQFAAFYS